MKLFCLAPALILSVFFGDPQKNKVRKEILSLGNDSVSNAVLFSNNSRSSDTGRLIPAIRKEYQRINSIRLSKKKYDFNCKPDKGTAVYYTEKGKVVKISIDWGTVGDASTVAEYYFKSGKLIFIYVASVYEAAGTGGKAKSEERTYINNDKTIKFMYNQEIRDCLVCDYTASSFEYEMLKAYNTGSVTKVICD